MFVSGSKINHSQQHCKQYTNTQHLSYGSQHEQHYFKVQHTKEGRHNRSCRIKHQLLPYRKLHEKLQPVDPYITRVKGIFVTIACKPKDVVEATFVHPYRKIFNDDIHKDGYASKFGIIGKNTNISIGDPSFSFYSTLYSSESTQANASVGRQILEQSRLQRKIKYKQMVPQIWRMTVFKTTMSLIM